MPIVSRFLRRTPDERSLLVTAALLMAACRVGLWLLSFQRLTALLSPSRRHAATAGAARRPDQIAWAVCAVSRYVPKATCLVQALTAKVLLERAGYSADLRFGAARNARDEFEAHAWVETAGHIVTGGSDVERFSPLVFPNR